MINFFDMPDLHYIQVSILKKLKYSPSLAFSELQKDTGLESSKVDFHIKQLIRHKLIKKSEGKYCLTSIGKNLVTTMDFHNVKVESQGLVLVWMICLKKSGMEKDVLIYTRKQHPYFGCQGFPAGKIKKGENIAASAKRELKEECGLEGEAEVKGLFHYLSYSKGTNNLMSDHYMYICKFKNPKGEIVDSEEGHYEWVKYTEIRNALRKPFSNIDSYLAALDVVMGKKFIFREISDETSDY